MARFSSPEGKVYEADSASLRQLLDIWHLKKAVGAKVDGKLVDCDKVFTVDTEFIPVFPDSEEGLDLLRLCKGRLPQGTVHYIQRSPTYSAPCRGKRSGRHHRHQT